MNDLIVGIIFYGLRLYMQDLDHASKEARSTALVVLNIRNVEGYQSAKQRCKECLGEQSFLVTCFSPKIERCHDFKPTSLCPESTQDNPQKEKIFCCSSHRYAYTDDKIRGHEVVSLSFHDF